MSSEACTAALPPVDDELTPTCPRYRREQSHHEFTLEELARAPAVRKKSELGRFAAYKGDGFTHSPRQILIRYNLHDGAVRCGFPDRTEHEKGLVFEADCGLEMPAGHRCLSRRIVAVATLFKTFDRLEVLESGFATLRRDPSRVRANLEDLRGDVTEVERLRVALREYFSIFVEKLLAQCRKKKGVAVTKVLVRTRYRDADGNTRWHQATKDLVGLALFSEAISVKRLDELIAAVTTVERRVSTLGEFELRHADEIRASIWVPLRQSAGTFATETREALRFFGGINLKNCWHAAFGRDPPEGTVEDGALHCLRKGVHVRIGPGLAVTP